MAVCAIRYCIGRQSYIVVEGIAWALYYGTHSQHVRNVIRRDLREAAERPDGLGSETDRRWWLDVLAELDALAEKEAQADG